MAKSIRCVVMNGPPADYPALFRDALDRLGVDAEIDAYPHINQGELNGSKLADIRARLRRRHDGEVVLFCPGSVEYFVEGADISFQFSAYRSWLDARTVVLPHPWHTVRPPQARSALTWSSKPDLAIGFMGQTYAKSRGARLAARMPDPVRRWLLEGGFGKRVDSVARLDQWRVPTRFLPTFARFETLRAFEQFGEFGTIDICDMRGFTGSDAQKMAFANHLMRSTYVLCPRGLENYSLRVFEALRFGRVPVIFDTDMALPVGVDWNAVALVVPGNAPREAYDAILADYRHHDGRDFAERQRRAFAVAESLDGDDWLANAMDEALTRLVPNAPTRARPNDCGGVAERLLETVD